MSNAYHQIMDRIELTAEARTRILENIKNMDIAPRKGDVTRFPRRKRYAALAACLAIVLIAAIALPRLRNAAPPDDGPGGSVMIASGIVEYASAEELSGVLGFDMPELTVLPFTVKETAYTSYWGEMGQIAYIGEEQEAAFRVAKGSEDISGDYNVYADVREIDADGVTVMVKGNAGLYVLAVWQRGGYSYALSFSEGIPERQITEVILNIK